MDEGSCEMKNLNDSGTPDYIIPMQILVEHVFPTGRRDGY